MKANNAYLIGFVPYGAAAFLIGLVGGFASVLGPAFVQDLGLAYSNITWTALAQAISTAACAPVLGKVGDMIGRGKTLLLGICVFALGNILSALANSLAFMLAARFLVGLGTAAMSPVILAYISTRFPPGQISRGFSLYMLISSAAVIFGPTLGSLVIGTWGWRGMQWVCVGICAVVLAVCLLTGERDTPVQTGLPSFDGPGAALVFAFFSLMLCVPSFGQNFGWTSPAFVSVLLLSIGTGLGLLRAERAAADPILSGRFIRRPAFLLSVATLFLTQGLMQANMTNMIVFVNSTQPAQSAVSGYAISVMYLGMSMGAALIGPLSDRFPQKWVLTGSLLLTAMGCGSMLLFSEQAPTALLIAALGVLGFGLGGNGTVLMKAALSGLPPQDAGTGAGTYGLFRDLAAPFGVAVFVPMFTNQIVRLTAAGQGTAPAAVRAIHTLAWAELACVAAGIAVARLLPGSREKGGSL